MRTYQRLRIPGGTYFFTLTLAERRGNDLLVRYVDALRNAFRNTLRAHPVVIEGVVILPDHLHCMWRLPEGDDDFPMRWRLIKFSLFAIRAHRRNHFPESSTPQRARIVATPLLGARHSERGGFPPASGLHPLQSRKTRIRRQAPLIGRIRLCINGLHEASTPRIGPVLIHWLSWNTNHPEVHQGYLSGVGGVDKPIAFPVLRWVSFLHPAYP